MLSAKDLKITFNAGTPIETRALRGMSLDIPSGQFVTVIGSNGAGKSTFLNAVSGDLPVDSGRIDINGVDVTRQPVWARAGRVARVFQDPMAGTCEDLTIEENMALAQMRGARRGYSRAVKASMKDGFRERLSTLGLGLENRLTDRIGLLSGGQRQAVSLLMAALQPSRILLLDEVMAGLNPTDIEKSIQMIRRIRDSGVSVLLIEHMMQATMALSDRIIVLNEGAVLVSGAPKDVVENPAVIEAYLGKEYQDA
ncbi:MAG TPA: ABC transporter ATP-binding protein [Achromobacter sp.]|nr:ABC transporter ATP-binding protein [Achromobacter sp.]